MPETKIAIVTINYHGTADTLDLLKSLREARVPNELSIKTYVVDNDSQFNSTEIITKSHPEVSVLPSPENLGFAAGNNFGITKALSLSPDYILLINNDCLVPPDFFLKLDKSIKNHHFGILTGLIYFAPGFEFKDRYQKNEVGKVIWYGGGSFDWDNVLGSHSFVDEVDNNQVKEGITDFASGAFMVIPTKVLKQSGLFNESYFMYLEDVDLCQRVKGLGLAIIIDPRVMLWHKVAQSSSIGSSLNDYFITRNRLLFGLTYAKYRTKLALLRQAVVMLFTGTKAQRVAIFDYFTGRLGKGTWIK